jgi:hypothetical protein
MYWFDGDYGGGVEFKNNLNFIVAFLNKGLLSFSSKEDFIKEIRLMFQEKSSIDFSIIKFFKPYSIGEFWEMMESLK